uniref:Uncharacterized protein n=1 Tax=viral metagenome TaxID=1070528 RepID=A0A6H1Z744_9ZZZZ
MKKKTTEPKVFASESVLREKREEIKEMEAALSGGRADRDIIHRNDKIQEPDLLKHEINKRKRFIQENTPKKLTGVDANKAYKRVKEIAEQLREKMPNAKLFNQRYPSSSDRASKTQDFERAVQQQMEFQKPETQRMVAEYRHLVAKLDPANSSMRNIEALRRAR